MSYSAPNSTSPQIKPKRRYIASLDGLRALAVLAVIAYHLNMPWAIGGLLGVAVFLVLSGYLITGLLVAEYHDSGSIDLPQFWLRRIRRLFPAIVTVIVIVAALCVLFDHVLLTKMRPDIVPSLFWFQNWWYIVRDMSYFEQLGAPSPLTHFWSLAIEEQFYLVWPLILLGVFELGGKDKTIRRICLVLAAVSVVLMAVIYDPHGDPTRVYYGTDTRAFSLLIGAWLSLAWPGQQLTDNGVQNAPKKLVKALDVAGFAALAALVALMVFADGYSSFMYYGGILLASLLTAVIIAVLVHPRSTLGKIAGAAPLVWVGKRSYGMYLWHFPIILLLRPLNPLDMPGGQYAWWLALIALAFVFAVSAASYRFVEEPIRRNGFKGFFVRESEGLHDAMGKRRISAPPICIAAVLAVAVIGCIAVPEESIMPDNLHSTGAEVGQAHDLAAERNAKPHASFESTGNVTGDVGTVVTKQIEAIEDSIIDPLLIGDSVPSGGYDDTWERLFPRGLNDSYVGRWFWQAVDVYREYRDQHVTGDVVVFACFSNHPLENGELDEMYEAVDPDQDIFLVNIKSPDPIEADTNKSLEIFAETHDRVHIIDWYSAALNDPDALLYEDDLHPTPEGIHVYYQLISDAVTPYLKERYLSGEAEREA